VEHILHYFAVGNTARGLHNLFQSNIADLKKIFLLNGDSKAGNTFLMKRVARHFENENHHIQFIHNAINPDLLDGIILEEAAVGIMDDNAIRVSEVNWPVGIKRYVQLDAKVDGIQAERITLLKKEMLDALEKASRFYEEALKIHDEWEAIYIDKMDFEKANQLIDEVKIKLLGSQVKQTKGRVFRRFLGAATPLGPVDYVPNLTENLVKRYFIKGRPGSGKSTMLKRIAKEAENRGYNVEIYHCGLDPHSLDMVIVRELGWAIFDSTAPHEYFPSREGDEIIDVYVRCITPGTDEDYQLDIENIKQRYQSTMNKGTDSLKKAKVCHDEIEKLYVANIEYEKLNQIGDRLIWMIDEQKV